MLMTGCSGARWVRIFGIKMLTRWAFLNSLMTIFKDRRPEIASAKDFLSCSHPKKVTATCSRVAVIQNCFSLFMCKASSKDGIYTTVVQCIIQHKIVLFVVRDMMTIITGHVRMKSLGLEIDDQISIPWVSCAHQE